MGWGRARRRLARASRHPGIDLSPRQPKQPCVATVSNSQHSAHTCRCLEHLGSWLGFPPLPTPPLTHPPLSLTHTPYSPRRCFGVESMLAILSIQYKQICWLAGGESHRGDGRKEREMGRLTACRVITPKKHAQAGGERGGSGSGRAASPSFLRTWHESVACSSPSPAPRLPADFRRRVALS